MLRWLDSFDRYGTPQLARRYASATGAAILVAAGRRGTSGALAPGAGQDVRLALTGTAALISGCALFANTVTANTPIMRLRRGGVLQATLYRTPGGAVVVSRGDVAGPTLGSSANVLTPDAYATVAWRILPDPTAGSTTVVVNGATVVSVPTANTAGSGSAGYDDLNLCGDTAGAQRFDDWYVIDVTGAAPNTLLPDVRVDAAPPIAAGTHAEWAPSEDMIAAWQCVDDDGTPNDDADYATTTIAGIADSYPLGGAPLPGATIYGAQVSLVTRRATAAGGVVTIAPLVRQFGADVLGAFVPLPAPTYGYVTAPFVPPGGAAQGQAWLSVLEFGFRRA
jgi:hypothetical protein